MLGLEKPINGVQFIVDNNFVIKRVPAGGLILVKPAGRPTFKRYRYQFAGLSKAQIDTFVATYGETNRGLIVEVTDHHGFTYNGIILNTVMSVERKAADCSYLLSFEVEVI